jgi:hypothetical protein
MARGRRRKKYRRLQSTTMATTTNRITDSSMSASLVSSPSKAWQFFGNFLLFSCLFFLFILPSRFVVSLFTKNLYVYLCM